MWVRSQYTSELAVLAAWVSLLVPWNVAYQGDAPAGGTVYFFRFALVELQFRQPGVLDIGGSSIKATQPLDATYSGSELATSLFATTPVGSATFYEGTLGLASILWLLAALVFLIAFAFSLALYLRTAQTIARLPVSEVRLMGALLGVGTLGVGASSVFQFLERDTVGMPIPIGVFIVGVLSVVLLLTKQVPDADAS
ncbi:hypothetical protein ACFQJ7_04415 [Halovenus rubra]|uniref:Uncharacterized protein n=2 Tax=Halovenus rubra TaxID=869890 RepID=A0ACC7DXM9_9EURY|nr:hypothetical protein [Halovenus rubra]